ncbi:hypothetical protein XENORESO_010586, partial [Xenotaenia resolanae]
KPSSRFCTWQRFQTLPIALFITPRGAKWIFVHARKRDSLLLKTPERCTEDC